MKSKQADGVIVGPDGSRMDALHVTRVETPKVKDIALRPGGMFVLPLKPPTRSKIVIKDASGVYYEAARFLVLKHEVEPELPWSAGITRGTVVTGHSGIMPDAMRVNLSEFEDMIGARYALEIADALMITSSEVIAWDHRTVREPEIQDLDDFLRTLAVLKQKEKQNLLRGYRG